MEIEFPIEFVVLGTALSSGASAAAKDQWKAKLREASQAVLPEQHRLSPLPIAVTLYYLPPTEMQGDIDNIVKPILDAFTKHIYFDDRQIERLVVQKFEPGRSYDFKNPTGTLEQALTGQRPALYVKLHEDLQEGQR